MPEVQLKNTVLMVSFLLVLAAGYGFYRASHSLFHAFDTGLYLQLSHNFIFRYSLASSLVGEANFLAHHFQPVFFLFTPVIALFPGAKTLVVLALMAVAWGLFLLLRHFHFTHSFQALLMFPLILNPSVVGRIWYNFCPDIFAFPVWIAVAIALVRKQEKSFRFWIFCLVWAGLCKETFWLTGVFITLTASVIFPQQRRFFLLFSVLQAAVFFVLFFVWMPAHSRLPSYYGLTYFLGPGYEGGAGVTGFLWSVLRNIFSLNSLIWLAGMCLTTGLIHYKMAGVTLLPALPGILMIIGSVSPQVHYQLNQYFLPVVPFLVLTAMEAIKNPSALWPRRAAAVKYVLISPVLCLSFTYALKVYAVAAPFKYTGFFRKDVTQSYAKYIEPADLLVVDGNLQPLVAHHEKTVTLLSFWGNPRALGEEEIKNGFKVITGEPLHRLKSCERVKIAGDRRLFNYRYFAEFCRLVKSRGQILAEYPDSGVVVYRVEKSSIQ